MSDLPIILLKDYGRLANRLMTFTNLAALSADTRRPVINLSFSPYAGYFAGTAGIEPACYPSGAAKTFRGVLKSLGLERARRFFYSEKWCRRTSVIAQTFAAEDHEEIRSGHPLVAALRGSRRLAIWKAWNLYLAPLVEKHADGLRSYFQLAPAWQANLEKWRLAQPKADFVVGVHVRRGDYAAYQGGRHFFDPELYIRKMRELRRLFERQVLFLVCSDEPFDLSACEGLNVIRGPGHEVLDLFALAGCQRIFGPPSTYSAWASWYGRVPLWHLAADESARLGSFRVHCFE